MKLRSGKLLNETPIPSKIETLPEPNMSFDIIIIKRLKEEKETKEQKEAKIQKMNTVHVPKLKKMIDTVNNFTDVQPKDQKLKKISIVYDIYHYIYGILKELYDLKMITSGNNSFGRLIEATLNQIPKLTQQILENVMVYKFIESPEEYEICSKCIDQMSKVQQLSNEFRLSMKVNFYTD